MPIDQITRQLNLAEERSLRRTLSREQHRLRVMPRRIFLFGLSVFGILWGSTALAENGSHLLATANFALVLTIPMLLWAYISASSDVKAAVSQIQNALVRNEVRVIQIKSHEMLDFEEGEDEGACYAFQLDNDNNEGRIHFR